MCLFLTFEYLELSAFLRWSPAVLSAPVPTHHPLLVVHFRGLCFLSARFSIPVSAQLRFLLWNLVHCLLCANVLRRTVFSCNCAPPPTPHTHVNTWTCFRRWWETSVQVVCVSFHLSFRTLFKSQSWVEDDQAGPVVYHKKSTPLFQFPDVAVGADLGCSHLSFLPKPLYNPPTRQEGIPA